MPAPVQLKYRAFLSYARADVRLAKWLHGQLEGFRIDQDLAGRETSHGIVPKTLRPIFRDQEDFSGGDTLADATISAIDQSAALLVLCSTVSATRPAVNEEVRLFRWRHPDRPVIPVIIDGIFPDNFPPALRFEIASDGGITDRPVTILGPDLREEADGRQLGLAKIVSGLIGVGSDDVYRRAERARRAAAQFRNAVIAVVAVLIVAGAVSGFGNWKQRLTNAGLLDATLAGFTYLVDAGVNSAANAMPLGSTRSLLEHAESVLTAMTKLGGNEPKMEHRKAIMSTAFSDIHRDLGQTRIAKHRLNEAQQIITDLVRKAPSDSDYLFTKAQLHGKAGYLLSTMGDHGGSVHEYQARHEIITRLAATSPDKVDWKLELAISLTSLVDTYSMRDDTATALHGYRKGLAAIEQAAVAEPGNPKLQRQLGIALTNVGFSLWQRGDLKGAQSNIAEAFAINQRVAAANPGNRGMQRDLARSQTLMAAVRSTLADLKGALPEAESASASLRELTTIDPDNAALRSDLAFADMMVAILQAGTDRNDASLARARSARDSVGKLVESDRGNLGLRQQIGIFDVQLGDLLSKSDQPQVALALFKSARMSFEQIRDQDPTSGMNQLMLVMLDGKIGDALTKAGHPVQALESYRSAVEVGGKLARGDPGSALLQETLADRLRDLGIALIDDNKADEAFGIFQTELATRRQLLAIDPANIGWQTEALDARHRAAEALDRQGKTAEAIEISREALAEGEQLVQTAPDIASVILALWKPSARLCISAVKQNDNARAASECVRAMELQRRLALLDPNNADYKMRLLDFEKLVPAVQLKAANEAGRYAEALALQAQIAARVEDEEKSAGKPGKNTAEELMALAWQALLAGEPDKALAACERSLALQPGDLAAEINRAHALMYLGRGADARTAYEAHKADLFPDDKKPLPQVVVEDFTELRKAGREHPLMAEIETALGITGKP